MELLLLPSPSRATVSRPALLPAAPLRRACATNFRPAATSGNVEATGAAPTTTAASSSAAGAKAVPERRAGGGGFGLGLDLSEEMRRGMAWRMLALPAVAVAAETALLRLLELEGGAAPAWAGKAGSAVLFAAGLLGSQYGFFSSRWDAAEEGSVVGWELAVRHWGALSMAMDSSLEEEGDDDDELGDDEEWEYYEEED